MTKETEKTYWDSQNPWGHELVVNTLVKENVEVIFTLTGGHIVPILNAAKEKGIRIVGTRTEEAAVLAAVGYSLSSGKVGVACLTAGQLPHAASGIMEAALGQVPVVVISGAEVSDGDGRRVIQGVDMVPLAQASFAKASYHITKWERIPDMLSWAFQEATTGIPGCAYVDIPKDILISRGDMGRFDRYPSGRTSARSAGNPRDIEEAVKALQSAKQPLITVGRMAVVSGASKEVKEFVELTGIPVDICLGTLGESPYNIGLPVAPDADVVLMLGKMSQGVMGAHNAIDCTGKLISVYNEAEDIGRCHPIDIAIAGDVKLVLQQMIEQAKGVEFPDYSEWIHSLNQRKDGTKAQHKDMEEKYQNNRPIHPIRLNREIIGWMIDHNLHKEAFMSQDGGDAMTWWWRCAGAYGFIPQYPGQVVGMAALQYHLGSVGMGLPMAVGAACARQAGFFVMPCMGDGAFGYHMAELETLARLGVPGVIVVNNNSCWGMVYGNQRAVWGRDHAPGSFLSKGVHYEKVAEGLGCAEGEYVEDPDEIRPALERAYERAKAENKPVLVNVLTDPNVHHFQVSLPLPPTSEAEPYVIGE